MVAQLKQALEINWILNKHLYPRINHTLES